MHTQTDTHTHPCTGVCRNLHELTQKHIHSYIEILGTLDLPTHTFTHTPLLSLSQCSMEQLLKAVGSQLLTSHLIIPLDRHEILSFSLSVSFALALIFLFLLCFYIFFPLFLFFYFCSVLCLFSRYSFVYVSVSSVSLFPLLSVIHLCIYY